MTSDVTVGVDIGTTSVKALAVDGDGTVLARARKVHPVASPRPDAFEHDPDLAWRANVLAAFEEVAAGLDVAAVNVAAMVPSLCAVDADGRALTPGLLYGDWRGGPVTGKNPSESGELVSMLRWTAAAAPEAAGYWPAQAVANHALCDVGAIDSVVAMTTLPLFDFTAWDEAVASAAGARVDQLPVIVHGSDACGRTAGGAAVGGGTVDAFGEQIVAGADHDGDVLVICGTTLMTWAVIDEWREVPGLWTIPHTAPGKILIGGPSNAGGLFLNWATALLAEGPPPSDPAAVPVWEPYVRGERTPLHDPNRRAVLHDLDLTMGPGAVRRAVFEAAGFTVRHHLDLAGVSPRRLVATGGGVRVEAWVQALADCTGLPVDVVAVPEGGAYGTAYLARVTAGLEPDASDARRWASTDHRVEPDPSWAEAAAPRYERFRELAGPPGPPGS
ncbi:MAG: FGGY-family carbohydrate kinase [Acidimicrobiales bacterium]